LLITSQGSVFIANSFPKIRSYEQIQAVFHEAYSSNFEADTILQAYGMKKGISEQVLQNSLISFVTDVAFGYSIHIAYQELSMNSQQSGLQKLNDTSRSIKHLTTAQRYKVKFGNPFPGPNHAVSHHCVDLIYIFDAFHDCLDAQDQRDERAQVGVSNSALRQEMQSTWVHFISGDSKQVNTKSALVYGTDKIGRIEDMSDDPEWVSWREKFDLIGQHRHEARVVMRRLFDLAVS
jgi:carboxylesterase type B